LQSATASIEDLALVRRAQRGDRDALVLLYRRYVDELFGYAYNQLGQSQDAEDLTSETFLRLVRAIGSFDGRSSFRTWIYTIMRNQLRDHWRRNGRRPTVALEDRDGAAGPEGSAAETIGQGDPASEAEPAGSDRSTQFGRELLSGLPDNYRRVLQLRIMDGRSIRHTAAEMQTTEGNVKVLQHRALKKAALIAAELEKDGDGDED
jgi:RNA polymerase sigma-70 factor (ECF subfamily)